MEPKISINGTEDIPCNATSTQNCYIIPSTIIIPRRNGNYGAEYGSLIVDNQVLGMSVSTN